MAERMEGMREVLVVQVPEKGADLAEYRDYVLDSLAMGCLVFGPGVIWRMEKFPDLNGVEAQKTVVLRGEKPEVPTAVRRTLHNEKAEKTAIADRLREYRRQNGLGCLNVLAQKCGSGGITADVLRDAINGAAVLPIASWRRIGKALDQVAKQEGAGE